MGVAVGRWISSHGFSLNVGAYLDPFRLIDEPAAVPGRPATQATSMEAWRQRPTPMPKVREAVIRRVEAAFGVAHHHLYTSHPLIRRKAPTHAFAVSYQ